MNSFLLLCTVIIISLFHHSDVQSAQANCSNLKWTANSNRNKITEHKNSYILPVEIKFNQTIQPQCVDQLIIDGKQIIKFRSSNNSFRSQVYDENIQPLIMKDNNQVFAQINKPIKSYTLWLSVPKPINISPGSYTADIQLSLTSNNRKNIEIKEEKLTHIIRYDVDPVAKISFSGIKKRIKNIRFDPFIEGTTVKVPLSIESNSRYNLEVKSENGALTHTSKKDNQVHYSFKIDNKKFHPNKNDKFATFSNFSMGDNNKTIKIRIEDDTSYKLSGQYKDTVTISISPKL